MSQGCEIIGKAMLATITRGQQLALQLALQLSQKLWRAAEAKLAKIILLVHRRHAPLFFGPRQFFGAAKLHTRHARAGATNAAQPALLCASALLVKPQMVKLGHSSEKY